MIETDFDTKQRALDKANAKVIMSDIDINNTVDDIKQKRWAGVTKEQLQMVLQHQEHDAKVWKYIHTLIKKDLKQND
jgi:hypothetical protein